MPHRRLAALVLAVTVPLAAGCGSSSSKSATSASNAARSTTQATVVRPVAIAKVQIPSGAPLARSVWAAKADAACSQLNRQLNGIVVKKSVEVLRLLPQEVAYERSEVARLARLVPPSSKRSRWQSLLNDSMQRAEDTAQVSSYAGAGDEIMKVPLVRTLTALGRHIVQVAQSLHLRSCAQV